MKNDKIKGSFLAPEAYENLIRKVFSSRLFPAYGQVATLTKKNIPQVRTVHFRYLKDFNALVFPTHVQSQKWYQLMDNPILSGCIFCNRYLVQLRFEATSLLIDHRSSEHQKERHLVWRKMRHDIRRAYWADYEKSQKIDQINIDEPCPLMGLVINHIYLWDIWKLSGVSYAKSKRTIYKLVNKKWQSKDGSPLHFSE